MHRPARRVPSLAIALVGVIIVGLAPAVGARDDVDVALEPVTLEQFGIEAVAPVGWNDLGAGTFARGTAPDDLALIAIQSAPTSTEVLWPTILRSVGLDERPAATGELATDAFDWTLHDFPVSLPGVELRVELALAEGEGSTYLVLLQAAPAEFGVLRDAVLVPVLEAYALLAPAPVADDATVEDVTYPGGAEGVVLAGTLTLPDAPGPHPVVILMSGSGGQDRDSGFPFASGLKPFAIIADALAEIGVGTLRTDDRGIGRSTGVHAGATIEDFASDAAAAIDFLTSRDDVDPGSIGLLGHSEGGLYASMLAASDPRVAFVVAMAAPAIPGVDLLIAQNEAVTRAEGESPAVVAAAAEFARTVMPAALAGDGETVEAATRAFFGTAYDLQSEATRAQLGDRETFVRSNVEAQLVILLSDWYRSILAYDPRADWSRVTVPVLALYGALDVQVPVDLNEPALREALAVAGNEDVETVILPDANHLFQAARSGAVSEYAELAPEFTTDFLPALVGWVRERAGVDGPA